MLTRLFKGRRKKISIQPEGAVVMSERTSYLLLLAALVLGILVLIDAAWARGRPPPPPPPPAPDTPPARYWHGFAANGSTLATASRLFLFGGSNGNPDYAALNDLWYYRVDTGTWTPAPVGKTKPPGLQHLGWACNGARCVAAGASNSVSFERDTWIYSYTQSSGGWSKVNCRRVTCPAPRQMAALAWDPDHEEFLLFGGIGPEDRSLDDTYTLAGTTWTARSEGVIPAARERAAGTHVPGRGVILFGGSKTTDKLGMACDMYAWNGSDWTLIDQSGGPCLHSHSMAWEPGTSGAGRLIVVGGFKDQADTPNSDIWAFTFTGPTSGTWQQVTKPLSCFFIGYSGGLRTGSFMARDFPTGKKVFFGGGENMSGQGMVAYGDTAVCD